MDTVYDKIISNSCKLSEKFVDKKENKETYIRNMIIEYFGNNIPFYDCIGILFKVKTKAYDLIKLNESNILDVTNLVVIFSNNYEGFLKYVCEEHILKQQNIRAMQMNIYI